MATSKRSPAIREPSFRSPIWVGAVALAGVVGMLVFALATGQGY
jgi:hypothetical protein